MWVSCSNRRNKSKQIAFDYREDITTPGLELRLEYGVYFCSRGVKPNHTNLDEVNFEITSILFSMLST